MKQTIVYLLDDEPGMLSLLSAVVGTVKLQASCFRNAKLFFDSVESFKEGSVMVLDLSMPDMDGIEVMRRLAKMPNAPALILISGHDISVLRSAEKLGREHKLEVIGLLEKPFQLKAIRDLLKTFLSANSRRKHLGLKSRGEDLSSNDLLNGIENKQLVLQYQPKIDIRSGNVVGSEALVRWQHPQFGLLLPEHFMVMVEERGWMGLLTQYVIEAAVYQEQQWCKDGINLPVSVNISAENITSLTLPEQLAKMLSDNTLNPAMLTLEITESVLMGELVTSLDILTRLRLKGIGLSIDDFGTGYSSLSQLHRIPFTELKIDCSFVMAMLEDDEARAIVKTCIILGHELNMQVVAEGVETQAHLDLLRELGCDIAQGYLFGKPMSGQAIIKWLRESGRCSCVGDGSRPGSLTNEPSESLAEELARGELRPGSPPSGQPSRSGG